MFYCVVTSEQQYESPAWLVEREVFVTWLSGRIKGRTRRIDPWHIAAFHHQPAPLYAADCSQCWEVWPCSTILDLARRWHEDSGYREDILDTEGELAGIGSAPHCCARSRYARWEFSEPNQSPVCVCDLDLSAFNDVAPGRLMATRYQSL